MSNSSVGMMSWGGMEKRGEETLLRALSEPVEPVNLDNESTSSHLGDYVKIIILPNHPFGLRDARPSPSASHRDRRAASSDCNEDVTDATARRWRLCL